MSEHRATADDPVSPEDLTDLVFRIFRVNGRLLSAGDALVAPLGLTSARWQVLGAIAATDPRPVSHLARDLGVSRQAVQRVANDLAREGIVAFQPNPMHKRAQLLVMTAKGRDLFAQTLALQRPWAEQLTDGLHRSDISAACATLDRLLDRLESPSTRAADPDTG